MPISLDSNDVVRKPLLDLDDQSIPPHTSDYQEGQAAKLHLSLGAESPGMETLSSSMTNGNTDSYKQILANRQQIEHLQAQNDVMDSILQSDPSSITPEAVSVIQGLSASQLSSPDLGDIVEREYAKKFTTTGVATMDNDVADDALAENPDQAHEIMDRAEVYAYKSNYLNTILDEAQKSVEDQSWLGTVYNLGENMVIGNYQTYNQVGASTDLDDLPALPGQNRLEGYAFLWGLSDPDEFKGYMDRIKTDLQSRNPYAFREWFQGMISFGNTDAALNNITTAMDIAGSIPMTKFGSAMKTLSRAAAVSPAKLPEIAGIVGKNLDSGVGKIAQEVGDGSFISGIKNAKELEASVPNLLSPDKAMNGGTQLSTAAYTRLKDAILQNGELARRILDVNTIDRLTPDEVVYLRDDLSRQFMKDNPQIAKNVIEIEAPDTPDIGNVYSAKVVIGQRDGSLFESEKQAQSYFNRNLKLKTNDYQIVQKGDGFQIELNKTLDESKLYDVKLETSQQTRTSIADLSGKLSFIRTPIEQVSEQQKVARSLLTTSKERIDSLFKELTAPIGNLSKKELSEIDDLLFINQKEQRFYDNIGEFENAYYDRFKKAPSEKQVEAYFAYTNVSDLDLVIRDLDWYKQKAAKGFEDIDMKVGGENLSFEGKVIDQLPYDSPDPFRIGIIQDGQVKSSKFSAVMSQGDRAAISKLQEQGYKIINAVESGFNIDKKFFDYVLVKDFKRSRVGVKNVDRKAGGHKIVRDPYYIKQGQISGEEGLSLYRGDKTFFNFRSEKEANDFVSVLNEARLKFLNKEKDAMKFLRDNIPIPTREFMAAVNSGDINLNIPFAVTRSGSRTVDTGAYTSLNLKDMTRSVHKPGDQITGRFAGERSESDINAIRSEGDTRWRVEGAPYLSPLEAMKSASADMISTRQFNDYKIMSTQNFIREFADVLDGSVNELKSQGIAVIQNPQFTRIAESSPELSSKVQRARNVSRAFNTLMDNSDAFSRKMELFKEKLISPIIPKFGPRGQEWLTDTMLTRTKNPASFFKSLAFHTKMGFWNPTQYFKQANAAVNIASVGGVNGIKSIAAYPFMRAMLWTNSKEILQSAGSKVQALGLMKADDFVESMNLYKRSGFNEIGGDVGYLDDLRSPELVESKFQRGAKAVLKTSATPFYEGERMSRLAAFNAAYMERKALLKGKALTRRDEADILYRAKTMIGNMTREANAPWQKGYASVITQFFGYQARIMDQFLGKQLTAGEKARLFTGYSMMYGLPIAVGGVTGVIPVRDIVVDQMLQLGMNPQDPLAKPFIDGFVSAFTDYAFGKDWNIASSYGPGGIPTFYDMFRGDKAFSDLLLGASGGIGLTTLSDSVPILKAMWSEVTDFDGGIYNLTADDWLKPLRNISSVNSAAQILHVYNFGMWASKNGFDIAKMELPDAIFATLTGLQPASIEESYAKLSASKELKEERATAKNDLIKRLRDARKLESSASRETLIRQIKVEIDSWGFTPQEKSQISRYAQDSKTLEDISLDQYQKEMDRKNLSPSQKAQGDQ